MIRCKQNSSLFPYTTLFRSSLLKFGCLVRVKSDHESKQIMIRYKIWCDELENIRGHIGRIIYIDEEVKPKLALDRKSTRLNSSHTVISYAVFCLKKKNINNN